MVRDTSLETYLDRIATGMKSKKEMNVLRALARFEHTTVNELFKAWKGSTTLCQENIGSALYGLRERGLAIDDVKRPCSVTGRNAYEWRLTRNELQKFDKPKKHKCLACNGTGVIKSAPQGRLF